MENITLTETEEKLRNEIIEEINTLLANILLEYSILDQAYVIDCMLFDSDEEDDNKIDTNLDIDTIANNINKNIKDILDSKLKLLSNKDEIKKFETFIESEFYNYLLTEVKYCYKEAYKIDNTIVVKSKFVALLLGDLNEDI